MSHSRVIGIVSKYGIENRNGLLGVYRRMLAIRPGQKRPRVKNRGFTVVRLIFVHPFHGRTVLMVACVESAFVRTVKRCRGLHVSSFSWGLWVKCHRFLYQSPAPFHVGISRQ